MRISDWSSDVCSSDLAAMGRAVAESKRADELRRKAASVGTAGISIEDPEAGEKIADKVVRLEAKQARMKAANAAIRKHRKAGPAEQIEALVVLGFGERDRKSTRLNSRH